MCATSCSPSSEQRGSEEGWNVQCGECVLPVCAGACIIYNLFIKLFVRACLRPAAALGLSDPGVQALQIPVECIALWVMQADRGMASHGQRTGMVGRNPNIPLAQLSQRSCGNPWSVQGQLGWGF